MQKKKLILLTSLFFGAFYILGMLFFSRKFQTYQDRLSAFEKQKADGVITELKNTQRGTFDLKISSGDVIPNLRLGWELEKYNITIGDSISKHPNSKIMKFYKRKNDVFEKCFEYEIGL